MMDRLPAAARRITLDQAADPELSPPTGEPGETLAQLRERSGLDPAEDFITRPHWIIEYPLSGGGWVDESNPLERDEHRRRRELVHLAPPDGLCLICGAEALRYHRTALVGRYQTVEARGARDATIERRFELPLELPYCAAHYAEYFDDGPPAFEAALPRAETFTAPPRRPAPDNEIRAPGILLNAVYDAERSGFLLRWRWHCGAYRAAFVSEHRRRIEELGATAAYLDHTALEEAELRRRMAPRPSTAYALGGAVTGGLLTTLTLASPGWPDWLALVFGAAAAAGTGVLIAQVFRRAVLRRRVKSLIETRRS